MMEFLKATSIKILWDQGLQWSVEVVEELICLYLTTQMLAVLLKTQPLDKIGIKVFQHNNPLMVLISMEELEVE